MALVLVFLIVLMVATASAAGAVAMAATLFAVLEDGADNERADSQQDKDDDDVSHSLYVGSGLLLCCVRVAAQ